MTLFSPATTENTISVIITAYSVEKLMRVIRECMELAYESIIDPYDPRILQLCNDSLAIILNSDYRAYSDLFVTITKDRVVKAAILNNSRRVLQELNQLLGSPYYSNVVIFDNMCSIIVQY